MQVMAKLNRMMALIYYSIPKHMRINIHIMFIYIIYDI